MKPKALSLEDAASLSSVPIAMYSCRVSLADYSDSIGYITAAAAVYNALQIPLPFLEGGRSDGYKPRSILVCVSTPFFNGSLLADIDRVGFGR